MKKLALLAFASSLLFSACAEPEPVVVERHHYHTQTRRVYVPTTTTTTRTKSAPSVGGSSGAEGFRAVEQPGTYSQ